MMKIKTLLFIIIIFLSRKSDAQLPLEPNIPPPGSYVKDTTLNKFTGTWRWTSGRDTFIMALKVVKFKFPAPLNFYRDILEGTHKYVKNGILIQSSMQFFNTMDLVKKYSLFLTGETDKSSKEMSFSDLIYKKAGIVSLTYKYTNPAVIVWKLFYSPGLHIYSKPEDIPPPGFSVPIDMVLTKF